VSKKWYVQVIVGNLYEIEVEAPTEDEAYELAKSKADTEGSFVEADRIVALIDQISLTTIQEGE
jgi:hypothetical protein